MSTLVRVAIRVGLVPFDVALSFIGPRYALFLWFFVLTPPALIRWLSRLRTVRATDNAVRRVPAYRQFLSSDASLTVSVNELLLPHTDKENYIKRFPTHERCVDDILPMVDTAIDESSG